MDQLLALARPTSPSALAVTVLLSFAAVLLPYYFYQIILRPAYFSILRDLPGPTRDSLLYGNLARIFEAPSGEGQAALIRDHGNVVKYGGFFGDDRLLLADPAALQHILVTKSYEYPKPQAVRGDLGRILGKGILFAEGDDHRRQRKIMVPAFSPAALRALSPVFFEMSYKLRDQWHALLTDPVVDVKAFKDQAAADVYSATRPEGETVVEVSSWLSKVTLDIIGMTGFGYAFNSLGGESNELANAFSGLASGGGSKMTAKKLLIQRILTNIISFAPLSPLTKRIPNRRLQEVRRAFGVMEDEARNIINQRRQEVADAGIDSLGGGKDLITLLLKSSMSEDETKTLSDAELMGCLTTLILAGHETTATSLTWTLYTLARHPEVQAKLRAEVRAARAKAAEAGRDDLSPEELSGLEYLDAVTREMLRVEPAVTATIRSSSAADSIPLSKPIVGKSGKSLSSITVDADQVIFLPISVINKSREIFGDDADEFRPERWLEGHVGEKVAGVGVYSHLLSFIAGPRSCIGYKFAVLELKSILAVLVDDFTFEEREKDMGIERRSAIVMRPYVVGEEELGGRMPLRIRSAK